MVSEGMSAKEFRREVGRELRRVSPKNNREYKTYGYRLYRRILRAEYIMLGVTPEKLAVMSPKHRAEAMIFIKGIVDWGEFLLTIQPRERRSRKNVEADVRLTER